MNSKFSFKIKNSKNKFRVQVQNLDSIIRLVPHFYSKFEYKIQIQTIKKVVTGHLRMVMVHGLGIIKAGGDLDTYWGPFLFRSPAKDVFTSKIAGEKSLDKGQGPLEKKSSGKKSLEKKSSEKVPRKRSRGKGSGEKRSPEKRPPHGCPFPTVWCMWARGVSFDVCGFVRWNHSIKIWKIVQLLSVNFPVLPLTKNAFFGTFFYWKPFFLGQFFRGPFLMGILPQGTFFQGTFFSGTIFLGIFFPSDFFSREFFSRGPFCRELFPFCNTGDYLESFTVVLFRVQIIRSYYRSNCYVQARVRRRCSMWRGGFSLHSLPYATTIN